MRVLWDVLLQPVATYVSILAISLVLACALLVDRRRAPRPRRGITEMSYMLSIPSIRVDPCLSVARVHPCSSVARVIRVCPWPVAVGWLL